MRGVRFAILSIVLSICAVLSAAPVAAQSPAAAPDDSLAVDSTRFSARGALIRSLVIPGWGQAYVGAPGRGAVYFAMEAGSLWMVHKSRRGLRAAREHERWLREVKALAENQELGLAGTRRQQVEDWVTMSIFLLFFSGADAYVSAQLSDFIDHIGVVPAGDGALRLQARVPTGPRR